MSQPGAFNLDVDLVFNVDVVAVAHFLHARDDVYAPHAVAESATTLSHSRSQICDKSAQFYAPDAAQNNSLASIKRMLARTGDGGGINNR